MKRLIIKLPAYAATYAGIKLTHSIIQNVLTINFTKI